MPWQFISADRFSHHATAWDALERRSTNTPFLQSAFIGPLLQLFGSGRELLALHASNGTLDAATLLLPSGRGMWQTFQPSQLPLGPWLCAASDPLMPRAASLMRALPGLSLGLGMTQLDPRLLQRPQDAPELRTLDYVPTSWVDVAGAWEDYWEGRGKNLRQNTRKAHNKLAADGRSAVLETVTDADAVPEALAQYGALESTGWKAEGGTAIHASNDQGRFYTRMLQNFCSKGQGRIVRYRLGDQVAAMDLCIDNGPLVVILKTTYDEAHKALSPSTLMRHDEFKAWWTEGRYKRIEFYGKTMEWHTRWTDQQRQLYHATLYRWPWLRSLQTRLARPAAAGDRLASAAAQSSDATSAR